MMAQETVDQADLPRLLALDARDKAKREKLRAALAGRPRVKGRFVSDLKTVGMFTQSEREAQAALVESILDGIPQHEPRSLWASLGLVLFGAILGWAACSVFAAVLMP